jgi:hypothetical protein
VRVSVIGDILYLSAIGVVLLTVVKSAPYRAQLLASRPNWTRWMGFQLIAGMSALIVAQLLGHTLTFSILILLFAGALYKEISGQIQRLPEK